MSLRLRLILAFVALSVVPLGAMTWYTYASNAQALRDAAEHESDMLASELSQRMQLITTQLSERVDHLMDMDAETGTAPVAARSGPPLSATLDPAGAPAGVAPSSPGQSPAASEPTPVPRPVPAPPDPGATGNAALEAQIASRLGDAAMLLNNVEFRGFTPRGSREGFPRNGPPRRGAGAGAARGASAAAGGPSNAGLGPSSDRASDPTAAAAISRGARNSDPSRSFSRGRPLPPTPGAPPPSPGPPPAGAAPVPAPAPTPTEGGRPIPDVQAAGPNTASNANGNGTNDRLSIDLLALQRQMFREIAPDKPIAEMDSAERLRVIAEVNQRLLGIQQGLRLGAAELQKQAEQAKREAAAPAPAPAPAPPAQPKPSIVTPASRPPVKKSALTGNRLNVSRERNGVVVRQINAEVNLRDMLAMVFEATPRDRGEVPFAIDKAGQLYTPKPEDRKKLESLGGGVSRPDSKIGSTSLPDWIVVTRADPAGSGLRFGVARPVASALNEIRRTAARSAGLGLLFICATLIGIIPLSAGLTRNLSRLNMGVHRLAGGDYAARVSVTTQDEIGQLAQAFNQMAGDVERHQRMAVGQERLKRELELGRQIQNDMLPHAPLRVGATEIRGVSTAAGEVGGDFFNYFELTSGQVALLVGDVSGKGVGAALLMANIQASLRTRLSLGQDLTALAEEIDRDIQANTPGPVYATLFVGIFDPATRILRFVNAGHNPQYVLRRGGGLERLESSGLPVGLIAGRGYAEGQVQLQPEDVVFCYTDGCVEAENEAEAMFGAEALERELTGAGMRSAEGLLQHMDRVLTTFRGRREPFDDATMMVVKVG